MQKKIGTILNEEILKKAKQEALAQHTTLNHIFEEALSQYLSKQAGSKQKLSVVEMSFGAIRLSARAVAKIAQEDIYATE